MKLTNEEKQFIKIFQAAVRDADHFGSTEVEEELREELKSARSEIVKLQFAYAQLDKQVTAREGDVCNGDSTTPHHQRCTVLGGHERALWFHLGRWRVKPLEGDRCVPGSMDHLPRIHHEACNDVAHTDIKSFTMGCWQPLQGRPEFSEEKRYVSTDKGVTWTAPADRHVYVYQLTKGGTAVFQFDGQRFIEDEVVEAIKELRLRRGA